jgi:L-2-hydroxyglutarate oxidase
MERNFDVIIVGAGIVGLSTCYKLLEKNPGMRICIIEKEDGVSKHQTGNNSGVIHSGIYYKPGSLKALNCRKGYKMLLDFCNENNITYEICGKIIVATEEKELEGMQRIYDRGVANGLEGLKYISPEEIREYEPQVTNAIKGIYVPQTGIIDYKKVSEKLEELIYDMGGEIFFDEKLMGIKSRRSDTFTEVTTNKEYYNTNFLVTCAGLQSDRIAKITNPDLKIKIIPFRGEYYVLRKDKRNLVKNLIYPVPDPQFPFLGVHFTRMLDGEREAGPNAVFALKREGYEKFDIDFGDILDSIFWKGFLQIAKKYWKMGFMEFYRSFSKPAFLKSLQRLIPSIEYGDIIPGGSGIRAQACDSEGNLIDDFLFVESEKVLHVCNAPSPAATACLAIGETIAEKISV